MLNRTVFLLSASMVLAQAAHAQQVDSATPSAAQASGDEAAADAGLTDIVVTAQKRSELINDVPMSITAATGETLAKQGVVEVADLQRITPGFSFQPSPYGNPVYNLRGIGNLDDSIASAPAVNVYIDQAPIPFSAMAEGVTLDVGRVEILKGPQGTLFGQNSTGGAINFVPNKPTQDFEAGLDATIGNFKTRNLRGFVSGPISDTLSVRVALAADTRGDWQRSITRPDDTLGSKRFWAARTILAWEPTDALKFELNVNGWINESDTQASQFLLYAPTIPASSGGYTDLQAVLSAFPRARDKAREADWDPNTNLKRDDNFWQTTLRGEYSVSDAVTLTSLTSYAKFNRDFPIDTDGTPYNNLLQNALGNIESFSQELRLNGTLADNRVKWMIGANYQRDQSATTNDFTLISSNSGIGPFRYDRALSVFTQDAKTKGVFGSLDFEITPELTIQGSARYTDAKNDFSGCLQDPGDGRIAGVFSLVAGTPIPAGTCLTINIATGRPELIFDTLHEDNISWRASVDWKPAPDSLIYANVTKGYKAGTYPTPPAVSSEQLAPLPQESVLAAEVGFKQSLFGRSVQVNGAGFYYNYRDKQISGYRLTAFGNLPSFVSIPKSSVYGVELTVDWRPVPELTINASGAYLDTKVESDFFTNDPFGRIVNVKGEQFPTTPKWTLSNAFEYRFPISDQLDAFAGASARYRSRSVAAFGDDPNFVIKGYTLIDLRAGVEMSDGRWRAEVWGRNVTNEFYVMSVTKVIDTANRLVGMPATYGLTLAFRY